MYGIEGRLLKSGKNLYTDHGLCENRRKIQCWFPQGCDDVIMVIHCVHVWSDEEVKAGILLTSGSG